MYLPTDEIEYTQFPMDMFDIEKRTYKYTNIYYLYKAGEIVYIGQAVDIISRLAAHMKQKEFDDCKYFRIPYDENRTRIEIEHIKHHKPKYNKTLKAVLEMECPHC